jgi:MFS transporter, UMF1 family
MLEKLGLHRPELRAWAMYDWALSGLQTVIMTAVFPIYFVSVAAAHYERSAAVQQLARANVIAMVIVAIISPVLGAIADYSAAKKRFLALFTLIGAIGTAAMFTISEGEIGRAMTLYIIALIGGSGCMVFYESLLPHIARPHEIDRVSTAGYGIGYLGGGLLVALNLAWIQKPEWFGLSSANLAARLSFVSVSVWWVLFAIPLFRRVREPARLLEADEAPGENAVRVATRRLRETLAELRGYRQAFLMLVAFLIYNDGVQTIIKMATAFGTEIGIGRAPLIAAVVMVQFVGVPFAFLFGRLASRIGAKPAIFIGLLIYIVISILGYRMHTARDFFILAFLVGDGAGRHPGPQSITFREHDPGTQERRILRVLQRVREVCGCRRAPVVRSGHLADRIESRRHPVGHPVLCRRRRHPVAGQRGRRPCVRRQA